MLYRSCILYIIGLCSVCIIDLNAQISEGGTPPSFKYNNVLKNAELPVQIPINFNVEDLKQRDAWQVSEGSLIAVSTLIETNLSIDNSGYWTTLPDGEKIWRLNLQAKGAIALMLYYKEFYIPEGAKLFIYSANKSHVLGAYNSKTNPKLRGFSTEFVAGDNIILEYVAAETGEKPRIHIEDIGYGYNNLEVKDGLSLQNVAGPCQVNINCEEGLAWQNEKNGVFRMVVRIVKSGFYCTGSLVNNTAQDFKPYVLSADHCALDKYSQRATKENFDQWLFYINYERRGCSNSSLGKPLNPPLVGCQQIASSPVDGGSDGLLLLLNDNIPSNYNLYFNGWDRSNIPAKSGASIHHPQGDYMKISTFEEPAIHMTWSDKAGNNSIEKAHWNVTFAETTNGFSVTEPGSSGSPLFNQNNLIVGTLSGGNATCDNPERLELYGKLYYHWDYFPEEKKRMDIFLDPLKTGVMSLKGSYNLHKKPSPANLSLSYVDLDVNLKWDAPTGSEQPKSYNIYRNNVLVKNTNKTSFIDASPEVGNQTYGISCLYADGSESLKVYKTIFISEYLPPIHVEATLLSKSDIELTWDAPEYQQTIYWGDGEAEVSIISHKGTPFYFGQVWAKKDIAPVYKNKIKAVNFFPVEGAEYSVVIIQGDRKYTQKVDNPIYHELNTIKLKTPFLIGNDGGLCVTIYVSKYDKNIYPAACDNGPAVNNKGNMFSFDGENWEFLYNDTDKESLFDNNFIVQAVISDDGDVSLLNAITEYADTDSDEMKGDNYFGQLPSAFFERTGYNIYRNDVKINAFPIHEHKYTDKNVSPGTYKYSIVALYKNEASIPSDTKRISVGNEFIDEESVNIYPILFNEQINISNAHLVKQIEIISIDGKIVEKITQVTETINTSHLQSGIYLFRLFTERGIKVIKTIKK